MHEALNPVAGTDSADYPLGPIRLSGRRLVGARISVLSGMGAVSVNTMGAMTSTVVSIIHPA